MSGDICMTSGLVSYLVYLENEGGVSVQAGMERRGLMVHAIVLPLQSAARRGQR